MIAKDTVCHGQRRWAVRRKRRHRREGCVRPLVDPELGEALVLE